MTRHPHNQHVALAAAAVLRWAPARPVFKHEPVPSTLTQADYAEAAHTLGVPTAAIRAFALTESRGGGFDPDGRPTILYEAQVFHRMTKGSHDQAIDRGGVRLSTATWQRSLYGKAGVHQWERHDDAAALDATAADAACSWGEFQILGECHREAGFPDVAAFITAMRAGAPEHLRAFCNFVNAKKITAHLARLEWADCARAYNGPGQVAAYARKLADNYALALKTEI